MPGLPRPILRLKPLGSHPPMVFAEDAVAARHANPSAALAPAPEDPHPGRRIKTPETPHGPPPVPAGRTHPRPARRAKPSPALAPAPAIHEPHPGRRVSIPEVPDGVSPVDVFGQPELAASSLLTSSLFLAPPAIPLPPSPPPKPSPPLSLKPLPPLPVPSPSPSPPLPPPPPPSPKPSPPAPAPSALELFLEARTVASERSARLDAAFGPPLAAAPAPRAEPPREGPSRAESPRTEAAALARDADALVDALRGEVAAHRHGRGGGSALVNAGQAARGRRMASRENLRQRGRADADERPLPPLPGNPAVDEVEKEAAEKEGQGPGQRSPRLRRTLGALERRASKRAEGTEGVEGLERTLEEAEAVLTEVRAWLEGLEKEGR